MYVHGNSRNSTVLEIIRRETERFEANGDPDVQRPLPATEGSSEDFSVEQIIKGLDPFIEKNDLKGALSFIRSYAKEIEKHGIDIKEAESLIKVQIEFNILLQKIDALVDHGKFSDAIRLVEDNADLIKSIGTDPEDIKKSVRNMEELLRLVEQVDFLIIDNRTKDAIKLINQSKELLKKLDITPESFIEEICPGLAPKGAD